MIFFKRVDHVSGPIVEPDLVYKVDPRGGQKSCQVCNLKLTWKRTLHPHAKHQLPAVNPYECIGLSKMMSRLPMNL